METFAWATRAPTSHEELIATLRERVDHTLRPLLARTHAVALVDFPNHSNVGDSAIWLGELAYLRSLGSVSIRYTCDIKSYSRDALAPRARNGVILLSGGGNLGDLWTGSQQLRERVISDFRDTPIIQLPQSIHFENRVALLRAKEVFESHPRFTLLVRDRSSLALAGNEFRSPSHLCPDMAFCLGPLERPCSHTKDVVWLLRTDKESASGSRSALPAAIERVDWLAEPTTRVSRLARVLDRQVKRHPRFLSKLNRAQSRVWEQLARQRLTRGCRLLAAGRTVITDRLHGHILSVLLGIPQLLLDNNTGKVRSFYDTWTRSLPFVRWCNTRAEALALARATAPEAGA
jgi:exopolysaccharide biosynthesis predicted pyruvyltransferase EpsI